MTDFFLATALFCSCALAANAMNSRSNGIPYVGPYIYAGLAISEVFWGDGFYEWVQESLE